MTRTYRASQLEKVDPDESQNPQDFAICIRSEFGATKWMNIDWDTYHDIANTLIDSEGGPASRAGSND